jgi:hypothetical protein
VGPSLDNLDSIAEAGETDDAHLVTQDSSDGVLEALNAIRGDAQVPCEISLSNQNDNLNFADTDVVFMDDECVVTRIAQVRSVSDCEGNSGGWFFSSEDDDRSIVLCERSCRDVRQPGAQFFYSVGCGITIR